MIYASGMQRVRFDRRRRRRALWGFQMNGDDDIDAFIVAGTRLLGLTVDPTWQETIRLHLTISLDHARNVAAFVLPDEADPAPVFTA